MVGTDDFSPNDHCGVPRLPGLELWLDRIRARSARRILATALRAELVQFDVECRSKFEAFKELLAENPGLATFGGPHSYARASLPPRRVWAALLNRIGEMTETTANHLTLVHSILDSYELSIDTMRQRSGAEGMTRDELQHAIGFLRRTHRLIGEIRGELARLGDANPPWWRRFLPGQSDTN